MELHDSCPSFPSQRPFTIGIAEKLTVQNSSLAPATVGVPYAVKLTATGGGDQTWSVVSGVLPAGLTLAPDGTLSGTPSAAAPAPVPVIVKVSDGTRADTKSLALDVVDPLAVAQPTFSVAEVDHALTPVTLAATGGRSPYTWALGIHRPG